MDTEKQWLAGKKKKRNPSKQDQAQEVKEGRKQ
jgi:hypothetical protein